MKKKPTNPLTKIRTGTGDQGTTFLKKPGVMKTHPNVAFVGDLDEACAALGLCEIGFIYGVSGDETDFQAELYNAFHDTIRACFMIGAMVHSDTAKEKHFKKLEELIAVYEKLLQDAIDNESVEELEGFIIPNNENGDLMLARTIIRRCERSAIAAEQWEFVPVLNAMSDFIFLVAWYSTRYFEQWKGFEE